jgi:cobalamin transport system substrate-binding protein
LRVSVHVRRVSSARAFLPGVLLAAVFLPLLAAARQAPMPDAPSSTSAVPPAKTAQAPSPAYREVTDEAGRTVRVPQPVERIVSLAPSLTETVYALGLQDHLVGDTDYCDYPPEAQKKPKVGGPANPSIEVIAALHPDLVLMTESGNRFETVRALDDLKIASYATAPRTIDDIVASTERLGDVLGAPQAGTAVAAELDERLAALQQKIGELPARRVLFVVWTEPLISTGTNTFVADALRRAGAASIIDTKEDWPKVSLEEVVRLQPEFVVMAAQNTTNTPAELEALATQPGWRSLDAVKNRRFLVVSDAVNRPAPRIVSVIEQMARQLHPEAFQEAAPATPAGDSAKPSSPATTPATPKGMPPTGARLLSDAQLEDAVAAEVCACGH